MLAGRVIHVMLLFLCWNFCFDKWAGKNFLLELICAFFCCFGTFVKFIWVEIANQFYAYLKFGQLTNRRKNLTSSSAT
jgi:hypothetical protein